MSRSIPVTTIGACLLLGTLGALGIAPEARAATLTPTNCNDSGAGSLRAAVTSATSGDTIDLRPLACHRIVLTTGAIMIPQASLTVRGPGYARFAVSGNYSSSVFRHDGTGTLHLRGLTIEQGQHRAEMANGGCIFTAGNFDGNDIHVRHCGAYARLDALGGGIYAAGNITLFYSAVYDNGAKGRSSGGGGLTLGTIVPGTADLVGGDLRMHRSRVFRNVAASGGGLRALGSVDITYSSISDNHARVSSGAMDVFNHGTGTPSRIAYSTISGNTAVNSIGGFNLSPNTSIENSTISGNAAPFIGLGQIIGPGTIVNSTITANVTTTGFDTNCFPGVLTLYGEFHVESSILAGNTCLGGISRDVTGQDTNSGPFPRPPPTVILGSDNLVQNSIFVTLPADTIRNTDAMLGPLADNGGRTLTHRPLSGSPAINRGNNVAGFDVDQRGEGFPRVVGGRADIGAVER
ncbi:hypothetical protein LYSHEL_26530 [Lysobacter helvus]|uniref:CSLREA domain-containing protein n=2 Tax=Lysobacteraceae TaxID=32033 RepID=A0ABN6G1J6_9GAMM|nr:MULTISPECIES: choice-of-anchor Q domain-containing protein [Lysobacter]BCT93628.1 hypothetical protein LYSCAS_26520 [Lysobacter caseinilyticus]BCT96782.1 hypothetical protein LYSHEL_26530 [Lysobacter helvus]